MSGPFHEGELRVQELAGESQMAERNGAIIASRVMGETLAFLRQQGMVVLSSRDEQGRLWCSMVFGRAGFLQSSDGTAVNFDLTAVARNSGDPLWANLREGAAVGMLVIELASRPRIRINGVVTWPAENVLRVQVLESYPNCPKYITRRQVRTAGVSGGEAAVAGEGSELDADDIELLEGADVLFLGTAHPSRGMDASHRGGPPGFVRVEDARTLLIPDYAGNGMFNTLGNLQVNAKAGMAVPDFDRRVTLQVTGEAETLWDWENSGQVTGGTGRFLRFHVRHWKRLPMPGGVEAERIHPTPLGHGRP